MIFLASKPLVYKLIFSKDENFTIFGNSSSLRVSRKFQTCLEIKRSFTSLKLIRVRILLSLCFKFDVLGFLNPFGQDLEYLYFQMVIWLKLQALKAIEVVYTFFYCFSMKFHWLKDVNFERFQGFQSQYCSSAWNYCSLENEFLCTVASRVGAYRFEFFEVRVLILIES